MSIWPARGGLADVGCEAEGCGSRFKTRRKYSSKARADAAEAGWSVRPIEGKSAHTAPDLCPKHAPSVTA